MRHQNTSISMLASDFFKVVLPGGLVSPARAAGIFLIFCLIFDYASRCCPFHTLCEANIQGHWARDLVQKTTLPRLLKLMVM